MKVPHSCPTTNILLDPACLPVALEGAFLVSTTLFFLRQSDHVGCSMQEIAGWL